ncbi:MAG: hypothetical protein D6714_10160 [Bacteroidetes bacterium]|nr:MAG: hypothetical protein D6714_10160 [Bacteroidota bacterium]
MTGTPFSTLKSQNPAAFPDYPEKNRTDSQNFHVSWKNLKQSPRFRDRGGLTTPYNATILPAHAQYRF